MRPARSPKPARLTHAQAGISWGPLFAAAAAGAAAMADQTAWFRCLSVPLGSDVLGSSAALTAFLAGLALGGSWAGRWTRRGAGGREFSRIQGVLAAASLGMPFALGALPGLMPGWEGFPDGVARFTAAVLALTGPAALMGATVPLLVEGGGGAGPRLYAGNALGALVGALAAGFAVMPTVGVLGTAAFAALLHAGAAALSRKAEAGPAPAVDAGGREEEGNWGPRVAAAFLGAALLGAEIVWMRVLTLRFVDSTLYSFTLSVAVVMAGLAGGAALAASDFLPRRLGGRAGLTAGCLGISFWALLAWAVLPGASDWVSSRLPSLAGGAAWRFSDILLAETFFAALGLGVPALLAGWSVGLLYRQHPGNAEVAGVLTAWNNWGAAAGAVAAGLFAVPWLGLKGAAVLFAGLPLGAAAAAGASSAAAAAALFFALAAGGLGPIRTGLPLAGSLSHHEDSYEESLGATVAVTRDFLADESVWNKALWIDGQVMSGTEPDMQLNQKMLAHVPMLLHAEPREVLSVGLGSGGTLASLRLHGARVTVVEILPGVVAAAELFPENHRGRLRDPEVTVVVDDARRYLARTRRRFDVVVSDVTNLHYLGNANLFTREYFAAAKSRLNPGGVFAAWVPREAAREDLRVILASLKSVFPRCALWHPYGRDAHFSVLVGLPDEGAPVTWAEWLARLGRPGVAADLAQVGASDPVRLAASLALGPAEIDGLARGAEVHSEWRPILDYTAPRSAGARGAGGLALLRSIDSDPAALFSLSPAQTAAFAAARRARAMLLAAYAAAEAGRVQEALELMDGALEQRRDDADLARSLAGPRARLLLQLADASAGLGDAARAVGHLERVLAVRPDHFTALNNLGILAAAQGRKAAAAEFFGRALAVHPEAADTRRRLLALLAEPRDRRVPL